MSKYTLLEIAQRSCMSKAGVLPEVSKLKATWNCYKTYCILTIIM